MSNTIPKLQGRLAIAKKVAIRKVIDELVKLVPELIKARTRLGAGTKGNLKALSKSTINYRSRYSSNLSGDTSPGDSNLTATGQLLESIVAKKNNGGIVFTISKTKRNGELSGAKSTLSNEQVRKYVEETREFFDLTDQERSELIELATELIKDEITRAIK